MINAVSEIYGSKFELTPHLSCFLAILQWHFHSQGSWEAWCQLTGQIQRVCCSEVAGAATVPPRSFITAVVEDAEINWTLILSLYVVLIGCRPHPSAQVLTSTQLALFVSLGALCFFLALLICSASSFSSAVTFCFPPSLSLSFSSPSCTRRKWRSRTGHTQLI